MFRRYITILCILLNTIVLVCNTGFCAEQIMYITREGTIITQEGETFIEILMGSETGKTYRLTGDLVQEVQKLANLRVRLTGKKVTTDSAEWVEVLRYTLREETFILGTIRDSKDGIVLVGENQVIYKISTPELRELIKELVDYKILVSGKVEQLEKYFALIDVIYYQKISSGPVGDEPFYIHYTDCQKDD